MIKFTLKTSNQEGFHLSTHADSKEDVEVLKALTEQLIAKIDKITVEVGRYE